MYCKKCNNEVDFLDKFCNRCGNDLQFQREYEEDPKYNGKIDYSHDYRYKALNEFSDEQLLEVKKCKKCQWYNHQRNLPCYEFRSSIDCFEEYNSYHTLLLRCHSLYLFIISFLIIFMLFGNRYELSILNILGCLVVFFILFYFNIHSTKFFESLSDLFNDSATIIHYIFYFLALFVFFNNIIVI